MLSLLPGLNDLLGSQNAVPNPRLKGRHLLSVRELDVEAVTSLLLEAEVQKRLVLEGAGGCDRLKHRVLASVFYEPSTRTSCSFQAAMQRLGGTVVCVNPDNSSVQKGETLDDTIQTMGCYCDAIVLRHPVKGSAAQAAAVSTKPVINAGDGVGEHPTQALLDLFTIQTELGGIVGRDASSSLLTVTLLGDLRNGRTVHSLAKLLALFPQVRLIFISPPALAMPQETVDELRSINADQDIVADLSLGEAIGQSDVVYVTRIQKERFASAAEYDAVAGSYCVDASLMRQAKEKMIVMHPLPRNAEIHSEVDTDPRAAYFRQMQNGMFMRMAILCQVLE